MQSDKTADKSDASLEVGMAFYKAWLSVKGMKSAFWRGVILQLITLMVILLLSMGLTKALMHVIPARRGDIEVFIEIIQALLSFPLLVGFINFGYTRIKGQQPRARDMLKFFRWGSVKQGFVLACIYLVINFLFSYALRGLLLTTVILQHHKVIGGAWVFGVITVVLVVLLLVTLFLLITCLHAILFMSDTLQSGGLMYKLALKGLWPYRFRIVCVYIFIGLLFLVSLMPLVAGVEVFHYFFEGHATLFVLPLWEQIGLALLAVANLFILWVFPWLLNVHALLHQQVFTAR
jgi:hypothetical protein